MSRNQFEFGFADPFSGGAFSGRLLLAGQRLQAEFYNNMLKYNMESLDFMKRRLQRDMELASQLSRSAELDEAVCCYLDFMRQAQIDYSDEMARLFRINAGAATRTARDIELEARAVTEEFATATAA